VSAFRDIAQQNIFPGESGGDYDALFGHAQRPGGQFAGVKPTDMTVSEILDFTDPSGPYGQYVAANNGGTVSTPVGGYQVIGSTLKGAAKALGLTGNEKFTPELQDKIGEYIYNTQGPDAWEGWGNGSPPAGGYPSTPETGNALTQGQPPDYAAQVNALRASLDGQEQQRPQFDFWTGNDPSMFMRRG
jgi:hypothetical protein